MAREVMRRRHSENAYLHRDFHGALSVGIDYLDQRFGPEAVRDYLRQFTNAYYAPLKRELLARGLVALKEHFESIYRREGSEVEARLNGDELVLEVKVCPAVRHMREHGYPVTGLFMETTRTVNEALCEGTPYQAELVEYEGESGRSVTRFSRRQP